MSLMTLHIPLDPYLAQWFIHQCGGATPVTLPKGSIESKILEIYLTKRPADAQPDLGGDGQIAIYIPTLRNRPPEYYNHLPKHAKAALVDAIRNRFDVDLWNDLHCFGQICRNRQDELITLSWRSTASRRMRPTGMPLPSVISVSASSTTTMSIEKSRKITKNSVRLLTKIADARNNRNYRTYTSSILFLFRFLNIFRYIVANLH